MVAYPAINPVYGDGGPDGRGAVVSVERIGGKRGQADDPAIDRHFEDYINRERHHEQRHIRFDPECNRSRHYPALGNSAGATAGDSFSAVLSNAVSHGGSTARVGGLAGEAICCRAGAET